MGTPEHRIFVSKPEDEGKEPAAAEDQPLGEDRPRAYRLVIVEDEYLTALAIEAALEHEPFDVVAIVDNGPAAIRAVERERPDLVIMDIRLSGEMDGIEAGRIIYQRFGVRCLYATAHADPRTRQHAASHEPLGWLTKPYNDRQLVRELNQACARLGAN